MPTIAELDASHRAAQAQNAQRVSQAILAYWLTRVNPEDLSGTSGPWMDFAVEAILRGYDRSYLLAAAYATAVRREELPTAPRIEIPRPAGIPEAKLRRSLAYTGPGTVAVELRKTPDILEPPPGAPPEDVERQERSVATRQARVQEIMRKAGAMAAGSAYKNVQNGGRDTTDNLVVTKTAVGYVRVTKDKPCGFCLALASRGPVYAESSFDRSDPRFTGPGEHKVHDHCSCSLRAVWTRGRDHWTEQARQADRIWQNMRDEPDYDPANQMESFRRIVKRMGIADLTR